MNFHNWRAWKFQLCLASYPSSSPSLSTLHRFPSSLKGKYTALYLIYPGLTHTQCGAETSPGLPQPFAPVPLSCAAAPSTRICMSILWADGPATPQIREGGTFAPGCPIVSLFSAMAAGYISLGTTHPQRTWGMRQCGWDEDPLYDFICIQPQMYLGEERTKKLHLPWSAPPPASPSPPLLLKLYFQ